MEKSTLEKIEKKKEEVKELEIEVEWMKKELQRKRDLIDFKKVMIGVYEEQLKKKERVEERKRMDEEYFEREREYQRWREWDRSIENDPSYRSVYED